MAQRRCSTIRISYLVWVSLKNMGYPKETFLTEVVGGNGWGAEDLLEILREFICRRSRRRDASPLRRHRRDFSQLLVNSTFSHRDHIYSNAIMLDCVIMFL